jgi:hypothetical protein|tara:strand:- start:155 stop:343 length:189 start_codon:yes stop_codon:yes gene_type:complete
MDDTVVALMKRSISESKTEIEQFLAGGQAQSMEDYCRLVGRYEALKLIEADLVDLEERIIAQ